MVVKIYVTLKSCIVWTKNSGSWKE